MGDGGEVGFYSQAGTQADLNGPWSSTSGDPNLPKMQESLSVNGSTVASFAPAKPQVWVGSWNPSVFDSDLDDMKITATVTFPNTAIYDAFRSSREVTGNPLWSFDPSNDTATISY